MLDQVIQVFLSDWSRTDTVRLLIELTPLFFPVVVWGVIPRLRKNGQALLILFSLFTGFHALFSSYELVLLSAETASRLAWPVSPFAVKLGFFHAAAGAGILLCLLMGKTDWAKGLLAAMALYAASSAVIHLFEAFAHNRIGPAHLGPTLMHDILFVFLAFWVLRKARGRGRAIYYVPQ
ncbi:MAG: DUF6790 family protein [Thermodesulfobacteriota bacterium]